MKKLAIVTTHPIQYNAPFFALLASSGKLDVKVFYTWEQSQAGKLYDPNFKREISWDIPLLDGYNYQFSKNSSSNPGSSHFSGIDNPNLIQEISEFSPDGLLVFGWSFKSHLKLLRHFSGKVPILFRGDSTLLDEPKNFSVKKLIRRMLLSWVYKHIDAALYTGEANREYFIKHGIAKDHLFYAPHAIDNSRFKYASLAEEKAEKWRLELGIASNEKVILFAGKLEPKKNPLGLMRAFKELNIPKTHLIIVGTGVLEASLKELAAGDPRIHFLGFQNQQSMPVVYRLADIFVLPSVGPGETWGLALNEAMACNRTVIASDLCGATEDLVNKSGIGWQFEGRNQASLKETLQKALALERKDLLELGGNAGKLIEKFSFDAIANAVIEWTETN